MGVKESYAAIGFTGITEAGRFDNQIKEGRKTQTIREPRKDGRPHVKVGYLTKLYWKMRTKECYLIGLAEVMAYENITLFDVWFDEENALADGFKNLDEFRSWFLPEWFEISPIIQEALETIHENMRNERVSFIAMMGRKFGKNTLSVLLDKLAEPMKRIKWKYPLE